MPTATNAEKRQARIAALTKELVIRQEDRSVRARARCKAIALELVELFRIEESAGHGTSVSAAQQFDLPLIFGRAGPSRNKSGPG